MTEISRRINIDTEANWGDWHNEGFPVEVPTPRISPVRERATNITSEITKVRPDVPTHDFYDDMLSNQMANGGE